MLYSSPAIVIRTVKYGETSVIAKLYTRQLGMQSFMIRGVRKNSKSASFKPAQLLNLNLLEIVAFHKQNTELQNIKEIRCQPALHELHHDFVKTSVGLFIAEVIHKCVVTEEPDTPLFDFLYECIQELDASQHSVALFPCWMLTHLTRYLGFEPKGEVKQTEAFDMENGLFTSEENYLSEKMPYPVSLLLYQLLHTPCTQLHTIDSNAAERHTLLNQLMAYYRMHHLNIGEIKSHQILRDVMG
jgi:DNA repair protein RecO (recombination protein O)